VWLQERERLESESDWQGNMKKTSYSSF